MFIEIRTGASRIRAVAAAMNRLAKERRDLHVHWTWINGPEKQVTWIYQAHDHPAGIVQIDKGIPVCSDEIN